MQMTVVQIAKKLKMTRDGVHKRIAKLGLVPTKFGRIWTFTPAQVSKIKGYARAGRGR